MFLTKPDIITLDGNKCLLTNYCVCSSLRLIWVSWSAENIAIMFSALGFHAHYDFATSVTMTTVLECPVRLPESLKTLIFCSRGGLLAICGQDFMTEFEGKLLRSLSVAHSYTSVCNLFIFELFSSGFSAVPFLFMFISCFCIFCVK